MSCGIAVGVHALVLAACRDATRGSDPTAQPASAEAVETVSRKDVEALFDFPVVPGWDRRERKPLPEDSGFSVGYDARTKDGPMTVTVFVYTRDGKRVPSGARSEIVGKEALDSFTALQDLASRKETYRDVTLKKRDRITLGGASGTVEVQRAVMNVALVDGPEALASVLVTAAKGWIVKIRLTQPGIDVDAEERLTKPLLDAIATVLQ